MNWQNVILQNFAPQVTRFTIVSDPDSLLLEESLSQAIRARGFDVQVYENSIQFRYLYETSYRPRWEAGEPIELVLIVCAEPSQVEQLPYDWLAQARRLHFSLSGLFPDLNYGMVAALDRSLLDRLYQAQETQRPGKLGEQASRDFILRHVFEIVPEMIQQPEDGLRFLLRRHYNRLFLPPMLEAHLIQVLSNKPAFAEWPLSQILPDRQAFLAFLQERWPIYLEYAAKDMALKEIPQNYTLSIPGPELLPFGHNDVRIYIDNLFVEGLLTPLENVRSQVISKSWMAVGIQQSVSANRLQRIERLLGMLEQNLPSDLHTHTDWTSFALRWAECSYLWHNMADGEKKKFQAAYQRLQSTIAVNFQGWLQKRYGGLASLPGTVMVNHVARQMRSQYEQDREKSALVVIDGLSLAQWVELRQVLAEQCPKLEMDENAIFAWVPTLTSVSRQAIFSGRAPFYFAASIHTTTDKESALWAQFWAEAGLQATQVAYLRGLGDPDSFDKVKDMLASYSPHSIGLVVDTVDKIMHGMQLGSAGMHNQIRQWAQQGFLASLLTLLNQAGYTIYLTSDHGNIEAAGCGKPNEGATADLRGERVRIYPTEELRTKTQQTNFPNTLAWKPVGLPANYFPLIAPSQQAFIAFGEKTVAHGGIDLEEVIVPFVKLKTRTV